jgi:putative ABC transport system permease protein
MRIVFRASGITGTPRIFTIVGIVADTREMGIDEPVRPFVYVPYEQFPQTFTGFAVRAPKLGASVLPALHAAIAAVDPTQPVYGMQPLQTLVDQSLGSRRFTLLLLSVFAGLGLSLAVLGIYGITSYSVVQRTPELAVRMAMGADDFAIVGLVLAQALRLVGLGLFLGAVLAAMLAKYLASLIYGLSPWDPQAAGLIAAAMVLAALVAGWVPARRAAALPLANALRTE